MKKSEFNDLNLVELSQENLCEIEGGCIGFNWSMFWRGCKIGVGVGATAATAAYIAYA